MSGPFVHRIDPVVGEIAGVYLWWYGVSYVLGFLGIHLWFRRMHRRLGLSLTEVYDISLALAVGTLLGGRLVEVLFYEWEYYRDHLWQTPAYWLGGMATHGLLLGAILGTLLFCQWRGKKFLIIADEIVIPGAWIMGVGRIGNFIDGQITGSITDVWWAVKFPDLEGFRHPVVLYDGLKNLLLIPLLLWIRRKEPPRGTVFAHFVFWYAFLRIFVDRYREYPVQAFGLDTGQVINIAMSVIGLVFLFWLYRANQPREVPGEPAARRGEEWALWMRRGVFAVILLFCLTLPSDWTQDIPERYGKRHPGLKHSVLYPKLR